MRGAAAFARASVATSCRVGSAAKILGRLAHVRVVVVQADRHDPPDQRGIQPRGQFQQAPILPVIRQIQRALGDRLQMPRYRRARQRQRQLAAVFDAPGILRRAAQDDGVAQALEDVAARRLVRAGAHQISSSGTVNTPASP
ncbi:hypothetical protein [Lysobacter enzymogenes]|uniref:hypothetical protein n=1 Tax=Lysobacter enzymogenes TaxID=69 RepID=UPI0019D205C1|nr:hypothetical protein [Lysobacter enzymogenes]